jgi:hypothetical protein
MVLLKVPIFPSLWHIQKNGLSVLQRGAIFYMQCGAELSDYEWTAIKPMLPHKPPLPQMPSPHNANRHQSRSAGPRFSYFCAKCDQTKTIIADDPMKSEKTGWLQGELKPPQ